MTTPAKTWTFDVPANGSFRLPVKGTFFKILSCMGLLDVRSDAISLEGRLAGDGQKDYPFDYLTFTDKSGAVNTVSIVTADAEFINSQQVNTAITSNKVPQSASFLNTAKTVTSASTQLIGANAARQYLLIQNKDPSGTIYVTFGGAATALNGVRIGPGGNWEPPVAPTTAANAIGDLASNANVVVVEG